MTKFCYLLLLSLVISQVFAAPLSETLNNLESVQSENDVKPDTPLVRTIRENGKQSKMVGATTKSPKSKEAKSQEEKPKAPCNTPTSNQQNDEQSQTAFRENQGQDIQGLSGNQESFRESANPEPASFSRAQQENENAAMMNQETLRNAAYQQDMLSQETQQQARTNLLIDKIKGHPLLNKLQPAYSSYGSFQPEYISYHQPEIQPVIHQKPVLFHQEVIKPIVHEVVKPLPVFHETVKPIVHEVVKPMPIVKEIIKPVPVVHEILKPYSVPVVHPVQFHHQPTQISVPMQWNCQLVPGPGKPGVSGLQNGFGTYGSASSINFGTSGSSVSSGVGGYGPYPGGVGIGSYQGAIGLGGLGGHSISSLSSYQGSTGLGGLGGHGISSLGSYQGYTGLSGLGGHGIASLGTYSLPIKTLPPKFIGHHKFKNAEGRDNMQDAIEDMIQKEELKYSSMTPSDLEQQSQDDQLFNKAVEGKASMPNTNAPAQIMANEQMRMANNAFERNMQANTWGQMRNTEVPMFRAFEMEDQQIPWGQMRSANTEGLRAAQMEIPFLRAVEMVQPSWGQMRSYETGFQQLPTQMRASEMSYEQLMDTLRSTNQQINTEQMRTAEMPMQGMRSAEATDMGLNQDMRSSQNTEIPQNLPDPSRSVELNQESAQQMRNAQPNTITDLTH